MTDKLTDAELTELRAISHGESLTQTMANKRAREVMLVRRLLDEHAEHRHEYAAACERLSLAVLACDCAERERDELRAKLAAAEKERDELREEVKKLKAELHDDGGMPLWRCGCCGCPAAEHAVDDEDLRECTKCECPEYVNSVVDTIRRERDELVDKVIALEERDDPSLDGTPNAHPAFWRGKKAARDDIEEFAKIVDPLYGVTPQGAVSQCIGAIRLGPKKDGA